MKNLRNITCILTLILLLSSFATPVSAANEPPVLNSEGVVLMDAKGQILYSKNPDKAYYPASTTKVLTALVVLENSKLDSKMTVGTSTPFADGTSIGLKAGEIYTTRELLLGLLMESGNDCAQALAENVSGSCSEFAKLMNKRAKELGAVNSNFENPSGLPDEKHVTTPTDLALIMKEAIKNPEFVEISRTAATKMSPSTIDGTERPLNNHNYILFKDSSYYYQYSVASKKGYTIAAKFTNVISATKGNTTLVASFLKGDGINEVYKDVDTIFDYGFANFETVNLYEKAQQVGSFDIGDETIPLVISKDITFTTDISKKDSLKPTLVYDVPTDLDKTSFNNGDKLVTAKVMLDGKEIDSVDLLSGTDRTYVAPVASASLSSNKSSTYFLGIAISLTLLALFRINYVKKRSLRKKKDDTE